MLDEVESISRPVTSPSTRPIISSSVDNDQRIFLLEFIRIACDLLLRLDACDRFVKDLLAVTSNRLDYNADLHFFSVKGALFTDDN